MINFRKHRALTVALAASAVLLIIGLVYLWKITGAYGKVEKQLSTSTKQLKRLNSRDPFPSDENVEIVRANLATLNGELDQLLTKLGQGQVEEKSIDPADFQAVLERTLRRLQNEAGKLGVLLPDGFAFGFELYSEKGQIPDTDEIPRLLIQLKSIDAICTDLMNSGIGKLESVERSKFEKAAKKSSRSRDRDARRSRDRDEEEEVEEEDGLRVEEGLYEAERYTIVFVSQENGFWNAMNRLGASSLFTTIHLAETQATEFEVTDILSPELLAEKKAKEALRKEKGEEEDDMAKIGLPGFVRVRLVVDAYRFELADSKMGDAK